MAPRKPELKPELIQEARQNGFLTLPEAVLRRDEALSAHYLELHDHPARRQVSDEEREAGLQESLGPARLRRSLQNFARRKAARITEDDLVQQILDDPGSEIWEESTEETTEVVETQVVVVDAHTQFLRDMAEAIAEGILPGTLVSEEVQEELVERIWRATREHSLDPAAPLQELRSALAAKHSWWQIDLTLKVITHTLALREKHELDKVVKSQDRYDNFIQDMQQAVNSTQLELQRFNSRAGGNSYQRVCAMIDAAKDMPEGLRTEQEELARSLRVSIQNLLAMRKLVDDSTRMMRETNLAETDQSTVADDLSRQMEGMDQFFNDLQFTKKKTEEQLASHFEVAGQHLVKLLGETHELEKQTMEHELVTHELEDSIKLKEEELREMMEKLHRTRQGGIRNFTDFQGCRQDLEDELDRLNSRVRMSERQLRGHHQETQLFHQDLSDLVMFEVAKQMEEAAERKAAKAAAEREAAQVAYQEAQERLKLSDDLISSLDNVNLTGDLTAELLRRTDELEKLSQEASRIEERMASDLEEVKELQRRLNAYGQLEVSMSVDGYLDSLGSEEIAKARESSPMQLAFVLQRLLPRFQRRHGRRRPQQVALCPELRKAERIEPELILQEAGAWQWRLVKSQSAPGMLKEDTVGKKKTGRDPARGRGASEKRRRESREGQAASELAALEPRGWAAPPQVLPHTPWDYWKRAWRAVWSELQKLFKGLGIWKDAEVEVSRLRDVISRNLRGLYQLELLGQCMENGRKLLGTSRKRPSGQSDEDAENRQLWQLSQSTREALEQCQEAYDAGLVHNQEQLWHVGWILARLLALRGAVTLLLSKLQDVAEEHEDLLFTARVFSHDLQAEWAERLRRWRRSISLDVLRLQAEHDRLKEDWIAIKEAVQTVSQQAGPELAERSHQLEETVTELATLVHCILENRWMRRKVSPLDHSLLLDWQTRAKELKAGLRSCLDRSAELPSKANRSLLRMQSRRIEEGEEVSPRSPEVEDVIAELMGQLVMQQESPKTRAASTPGMSPRGVMDSPRKAQGHIPPPLLPPFFLEEGELAESLGPDSPRRGRKLSSVGSEGARTPLSTSPVGTAGKGPGSPGSPHSPFRVPSGGEPGDDALSERSALGGVSDDLNGFESPRSARSLRPQADLLEDAFLALRRRRLDSATTEEERAYQEELMDAAYREVRLSIHHTEPLFDSELLVDDLYEGPEESRDGSSSDESERMSRARSDSQVFAKLRRTTSGQSLVKSRSWAMAGSLGKTPTREYIVRGEQRKLQLKCPKAIRVEPRRRPQRLGGRRLRPLLLPWATEEPEGLHLGARGVAKGHEALHVIAATPAAPLQSMEDRKLKREALINQPQGSRAATPQVEVTRASPLPEAKASQELLRPRSARSAQSRPSSAHSGHSWKGLLSAQLEGDGLEEPPRNAAKRHTVELLAPQVKEAVDYRTVLEEQWRPLDEETLKLMNKDPPSLPRPVEVIPEIQPEDQPTEIAADFLDAPLDEALLRPQQPELQATPHAGLSDFALHESPAGWEGTPSPWGVAPPSTQEVIAQLEKANECNSRASTGTPKTLAAFGQRCRAQDTPVTLPAIQTPVQEAEEAPRPASVDVGKRVRPSTGGKAEQGATLLKALAGGPRPFSATGISPRLKQIKAAAAQLRSDSKPLSARATAPERRDSLARAATLAQQELVTKMRRGSSPADGGAKGWLDALAHCVEPKVQRVLSQGLAAQLTSECSRLATTGKMRVPQGTIRTSIANVAFTRRAEGATQPVHTNSDA